MITTLLVLQTGRLNRHSPPPSSRWHQHAEMHRRSYISGWEYWSRRPFVCRWLSSRPLANVAAGPRLIEGAGGRLSKFALRRSSISTAPGLRRRRVVLTCLSTKTLRDLRRDCHPR